MKYHKLMDFVRLQLVALDVLRRAQQRSSIAEDWKSGQMEEKQEINLIELGVVSVDIYGGRFVLLIFQSSEGKNTDAPRIIPFRATSDLLVSVDRQCVPNGKCQPFLRGHVTECKGVKGHRSNCAGNSHGASH